MPTHSRRHGPGSWNRSSGTWAPSSGSGDPMFHWTDSKIRVHAFYCVLALILGSLLQRRAAQNGLPLSMQGLFKVLSGIQEVTNVFPAAGKLDSPGRPHLKTTLTEMDSTQQALFRLFALDRYRNP